MTISVSLRPGEPLEKGMRIMKKKVDREGVLRAVKAKRHYAKPSVAKKEKSKMARKYKHV